ncbi:lytic murein transglycosylase, partial [Streptomyces sp. NRRL F-5065]|uniref:lytic transglycosylase domain-containing protein n=1 Tax=Streptomyces sp. NRRL F-5065 TaxID=1463855 RepID=UPI0004BF83BB
MAAQFGRRLRKGAVTTTVAAVAVAALSASQAPDVTGGAPGTGTTSDSSAPRGPADGDSATGNSPYYTALPPLNSPNPAPATGTADSRGPSEAGIPATVLDAYKKAEATLRRDKPGCNLPWQLLAAIGKVESGHANGGRLDAEGTTLTRIIGPQLDGNGFALIKDTDGGRYDGNSEYDNAVGPMQFIPSTWAWAGRDGNGDGVKDPNNIHDATLAAGHYLCRNGWDLSRQADLRRAVLSYNNSEDYFRTVMSWLEYYRQNTHEIPDGTGPLPGARSDSDRRTTRPGPATGTGGSTGRTPGSGPGVTPGPSAPAPAPGKPAEPARPTEPTPPGTGSPRPEPSDPPAETPTPTPTDTVHRLENAGTPRLTATAGDAFAQRIGARAVTQDGDAVAGVRVRFTVTGDTDAAFAGGENVATVRTDASGLAHAPALRAGEKTGVFTVRATVVGRLTPVLSYRATVTERTADTLVRTAGTPLTCAPGEQFADRVRVKATREGEAAGKVAVTATLVTSGEDPAENDKGPHFKDADGNAVRTLTGLRTDADGLLTLPELYADDTTGTFVLRLTTAGGATLDVRLDVAEPEAEPSPGPSTGTDRS